MAVLGYICYMVLTLYVSLITSAVFVWPSDKMINGERVFMLVLFILFWTGAAHFWPFEPMVLK
jgi:hypothetical protein